MEARPSGWDHICPNCSRRSGGYPPTFCLGCGISSPSPDRFALWGHEWAAVAWMRLCLSRADETYGSWRAADVVELLGSVDKWDRMVWG